jgi:opacity protein-like surface antigen
MKEDHFDDILKKKLSGFVSDVPEGMWERIHDKGKRRKKPVLFFCICTFAILLLSVRIGYNHLFVQSGNNAIKTKAGKSIKQQNSPDLKAREDRLSVQDTVAEKSSSILTSNMIFKRSFSYTKADTKLAINRTKNHTYVYNHPDANVTPSMKSSNDKSVDETEADDHKIIDTATTGSFKKTSTKRDTTISSQNKETPKSETGDKFSIEVFGSPFYPVNIISSSNTVYEQLLKKSSNMQLSAAVGIRFRYAITERISATLGFTYSNLNEKINFKNSGNGLQYQVMNHYQFLDIPLLMSYKILLSHSFSSAVNAGIVLNVSSKFKGAIPSASSDPLDIANANVYYANRGAGLYVSVDLSKNIGSKMYFFVEPYLQASLKNMTNTFQTFKQKIQFTGINLGAGYHF